MWRGEKKDVLNTSLSRGFNPLVYSSVCTVHTFTWLGAYAKGYEERGGKTL